MPVESKRNRIHFYRKDFGVVNGYPLRYDATGSVVNADKGEQYIKNNYGNFQDLIKRLKPIFSRPKKKILDDLDE